MGVGGKGSGAAARGLVRRCALALIAVGLALALVLFGSLHAAPAYASINPASSPTAAQVSDESAAAGPDEAASDAGSSEAVDGEAIEDDEVPMSDGLGGGEPMAAAGANLQWIIVAGIVLVVVFFGVSTLKVNKSISSMKDHLR